MYTNGSSCRCNMYVAASYPTVKLSVTDGCILEGQNVSLTCQVTYNGTNLMPLVITWSQYRWHLDQYETQHISGNRNTVNVSSVHYSTWTFTATGPITETCKCGVSCSLPTGLVLPGVQQQSMSVSGYYSSSRFPSRTVASETIVYGHIGE